ncbi:MAG: anthranilate phosphoribosyltransferase [Rubrivivax sp.]|nr:anthranilate phosphoribosyltransferase [Pyrinomonadaceae bacterium]
MDAPFSELLSRLIRGDSLGRDGASLLLDSLLGGEATDAQIGAALIALAAKGETVEELVGMAEVMRARSTRIKARHRLFLDTAGTGSSSVKTFNVSTAAAFVTAGAGLPVAKHGGRAVTSRTGSADVLTALGVRTDVAPEVAEKCLDEIGICFMFAPLYHSATARVAGIRRELGVHTVFNLLGPLTNPAGAPRQLVGVWHPSLVVPMASALAALGTERAWVVHGLDGLDEVTMSGKTRVAEARGGQVEMFEIEPEDFGLNCMRLDGVRAEDAEMSARAIRDVLEGRRRDVARALVIANAAAALFVGGMAGDLKEAAQLASQSLDDGAAHTKLQELVRATNP